MGKTREQSTSFARAAALAAALVLITLAVFRPVTGFEFINYDDPNYFSENAHVRAGLTLEGVRWAFTTGHASNWHPLTWVSLMLDAELFGEGPRGPHLTNLIFHALNTLLVFALLRSLTGAVWRSAVAAALFALHPLHVESVAWVAERKDVLSGFFGLLTLWAYAVYARRARGAQEPGKLIARDRRYWAAVLLFIAGLMSKPMLVTLPCLMLLLDYWPLRRFAGAETGAAFGRKLARLGIEKWPFFLCAAASSFVTWLVQKQGGSVQAISDLPLGSRLANAAVAYSRYLGKTFWPDQLAVFYPMPPHWPAIQIVLSTLLLAGVTLAVLLAIRRCPYPAIGWFWFLGMMVPVIGLVQVGEQSMADRYTYLPLIGVFIGLIWLARDVAVRRKIPTIVCAGLAVAVVTACGLQTRRQLRHWENAETVLRHALSVTRGNHLAHYNLGNILLERGQLDEAVFHLEQAVIIKPVLAEGHNNLALALRRSGRLEEAEARFLEALRVEPGLAIAHNGYANLLLQLGRADEAIGHYRAAIENDPKLAEAHFNLALAFSRRGEMEEAEAHYLQALTHRPDLVPALANLGGVYLQGGRVEEAVTMFRRALSLRNDLPAVVTNLRQIAWVYATATDPSARNGARAVELAEALNRTHPEDPETLAALAAAYAESGRFQDAVRAVEAAMSVAGDAAFRARLQQHLELYRNGQPVRER